MVKYSRRYRLSKPAKCLGGKSTNEPKHPLTNLKFLNPRSTESSKFAQLKFLRTVNRAVTFQYSELTFLKLDQKLNRLY